jgi:hypothetical protein
VIDVTNKAIEETVSDILRIKKDRERAHLAAEAGQRPVTELRGRTWVFCAYAIHEGRPRYQDLIGERWRAP